MEQKLRQLEKENKKLRKIKTELLKNEARFKALMEQNPISIEIYRPDGTHQEVNHAWQELFGVKPEDTIGKYNCLQDKQAAEAGAAKAFKNVLAGKSISIPDVEYDPALSGYPEGRKRWLRSNFFPVKDDNGIVQHVVLMHEDITDRIKTQERYKWLVETSNEAILIVQNGFIRFHNNKLVELLGFLPEEIQSMQYQDFVHNDDRERIIKVHQKRLNGETIDDLTRFRVTTKTGEIIWLQTNAVLVDWDDKPASLIFASDITELKNSEEKLNQYKKHLEQLVDERTKDLERTNKQLAEQIEVREKTEKALFEEKSKLEAILAAMKDGLTVQDRNFKVLYQNEAHKSRQGDCAGEFCHKAYQNNDSVCKECIMAKCFKDGNIHQHEASAIGKNGETIYMEVTASPIKDEQGNIISGVEVVRDITDTKKLTAQLLQKQKIEAIGTLAGGIAHDFNNILTGILGYAELSLLESQKGKVDPNALNSIIEGSKRAADLVKQILTFSRQAAHEYIPLELRPLVNEAIKLLRASLPSTIKMAQEIDSDCGIVLGDATQIHQIIVNLCTNSLHAMRETGGNIDIQLHGISFDADIFREDKTIPAGHYVILSVSDTGHGMDQKTKNRIFDPYFTNKKQGEGSGLGLATVHGIVNNHRGYITVDSAPGKGTKFDIYFPVVDHKEHYPGHVPLKLADLPTLKGTVLLVDDEEIVLHLAKAILEKIGCQVKTYTNVREALEAFEKDPHAYDLVITDQTMPSLTGYEFAKKILTMRPGTPIILATGYSDLVDEKKARQAGIHTFLMKPFDLHSLSKAVSQILR